MKHYERHLLKTANRRFGHQDQLIRVLEQTARWKQALAKNLREGGPKALTHLVEESVGLEIGLHSLKILLNNPPDWERIKQKTGNGPLRVADLLNLEGQFTQALAVGLGNPKTGETGLSLTGGSLEGSLNYLRKDLAEEKLWKNLRHTHLQNLACKLGLIKGVA